MKAICFSGFFLAASLISTAVSAQETFKYESSDQKIYPADTYYEGDYYVESNVIFYGVNQSFSRVGQIQAPRHIRSKNYPGHHFKRAAEGSDNHSNW